MAKQALHTHREFLLRLDKVFDGASMADVARRLGVPHATVRNYYKSGRLPASEVLIKIARETGVSLNWLLLGTGDMYAGNRPPIGIGKFIEEKIAEMIDERIASRGKPFLKDTAKKRPSVAAGDAFDVEAAVLQFDDPERVMSAWFRHEGRRYPKDYGVVFFRGWETFSPEEKIAAVCDAKRVLDRTITPKS